MLTHASTPNPFIAGSSVQNQQIECLWCDVFRCVLSVYHHLFYYLEGENLTHALADKDLYSLHLVYLNRINITLKAFQDGWNNHAITTEHSMTPLQLFTSGILLNEQESVRVTVDPAQLNTSQEELEIPDGISVPSIPRPISQDDARRLQAFVESADQEQNDYGIELYDMIRGLVHERS